MIVMIVAVTGYIGVGKTTFSEQLALHGFKVINVDSLGHALLLRHDLRDKLVGAFGDKILGRDLRIDRKLLSEVVFGDDSKLEKLNSVIHRPLKEALMEKVSEMRKEDIIIDCALFKKLGVDLLADKVVLIKSDLDNIYSRLQSRYTKLQVINVMDSQEVPVDADFVVENNSSVDELKRKAEEIAMSLNRTINRK